MKVIDRIKTELIGGVFAQEEIDRALEAEEFYPDEEDRNIIEGVLKYTNRKSQIWVRYTEYKNEYLIEEVTRCTKRRGSTKVRAFHTVDEIKGMMTYFRDNEMYDELLVFILGCLLARRVGDTLSLKWSDFYHENGARKNTLTTLVEEKTDKIVKIKVTDTSWQYIDWYCEEKNINPIEHLHEDIFLTDKKREALSCSDPVERREKYRKSVESLSAAYRYRFKEAAEYNGIDGVSTHSTRKTFGYFAHILNKDDPDHLLALQAIFGHDSIETTKIYIDVIDNKSDKMFDDVSAVISDAEHGIAPSISNLPVVTLRSNDLRGILATAYTMGRAARPGDREMDIINELITMVEEKRISC